MLYKLIANDLPTWLNTRKSPKNGHSSSNYFSLFCTIDNHTHDDENLLRASDTLWLQQHSADALFVRRVVVVLERGLNVLTFCEVQHRRRFLWPRDLPLQWCQRCLDLHVADALREGQPKHWCARQPATNHLAVWVHIEPVQRAEDGNEVAASVEGILLPGGLVLLTEPDKHVPRAERVIRGLVRQRHPARADTRRLFDEQLAVAFKAQRHADAAQRSTVRRYERLEDPLQTCVLKLCLDFLVCGCQDLRVPHTTGAEARDHEAAEVFHRFRQRRVARRQQKEEVREDVVPDHRLLCLDQELVDLAEANGGETLDVGLEGVARRNHLGGLLQPRRRPRPRLPPHGDLVVALFRRNLLDVCAHDARLRRGHHKVVGRGAVAVPRVDARQEGRGEFFISVRHELNHFPFVGHRGRDGLVVLLLDGFGAVPETLIDPPLVVHVVAAVEVDAAGLEHNDTTRQREHVEVEWAGDVVIGGRVLFEETKSHLDEAELLRGAALEVVRLWKWVQDALGLVGKRYARHFLVEGDELARLHEVAQLWQHRREVAFVTSMFFLVFCSLLIIFAQ
eukprot:PhM_4_TR1145/c0_g1_i1/m.61814